MAETIRPDIAVVGASAAGLGAARTAAEAGAETVLLEAREIGVPEPPAKVAFEHLWHAQQPPPDHAVQRRIAEVLVHSPGGHRLAVEAPAWVLDRTVFDQHLCARAEDAGASVRASLGELEASTPTHLRAPEAGLVIEPRVTLFADGTGTLAQAFLELTQRPEALAWGAWDALTPDPSAPEDRIHITVGQHAPGGRTQLTPVGEGTWAHWTFVTGTRQDLDDHAPRALRHTLQRVSWPEELQRTASRVAVGPDPVFRVPHRLAGDRFAVVGGAVGQGGLEVGVASGELAGRHAARAVTDPGGEASALQGYAQAWRARYQAGYEGLARWNRWLARLEDRHLDRLLAPWDGTSLPVQHIQDLGRRDLRGPVRGLVALGRQAPGAVLATVAAMVPAVGQVLGPGDLSPDRPDRRPGPW